MQGPTGERESDYIIDAESDQLTFCLIRREAGSTVFNLIFVHFLANPCPYAQEKMENMHVLQSSTFLILNKLGIQAKTFHGGSQPIP